MSELPKGWAQATLAELGDWSSGGTPSRSKPDYFDGDIPFVKTGDLNDSWLSSIPETISDIGLQNSSAKLFPEGTLLIAMYGATIGKTARLSIPAATNQACAALLGNEPNADALDYVWAYLRSQLENLRASGKGGAQPNISQTLLKSYPIPLPPLAEQQRIVNKLDTLSALTTTTRSHLNTIAKLVERYKLAVLERAYFGPQTNEWEMVSFLDTTESTQNGLSKRRGDEGKPTKVLRLADLSGNVFVGDDPREIVLTEKEEEKFSLLPDDIVIVRVNGSEKIVGRMLVWTNEPEWSYCDHFIRARVSSAYSPSFIRWLFETNTIRTQIEATFVSSAGQKTINKTILSQVMVPSIAIEEQREIVRWIETAFAKIDRLASEATKALKLADRLDQRILAKAFAGELVPQDSNDEPASALLERIREARANASKKPRKKTTKAKSMKVAPQERVLTDSAEWPEQGLPFEDIAKRLTLPHDDLKDAVFALLEGDAPRLRQQFEADAKVMKLLRVKS